MSAQDTIGEILKVVEELTTKAMRNIDEKLMKTLKNTCKSSDDYVNYTYYALMTQLRKNHAEIRYSTLLVINELFHRSSTFRKLLESDMEEFLELVVETDPDIPLPLPKLVAKELKSKGLQFVKEWSSKFGAKCKRLNLAYTYLKSCKLVNFENSEARNSVDEERHRRELESRERATLEKIQKIRTEIPDISEDITSILTQTENCFQLLIPHPKNFLHEDIFENSDPESNKSNNEASLMDTDNHQTTNNDVELGKSEKFENERIITNSDSFRHHGVYDRKSNIVIELTQTPEIAIETNEDTLPILETLNDLHRQINSKYLPLMSKWLKILTKGSNCTDLLKMVIDIKQQMEAMCGKYKEMKITPTGPSNLCRDQDNDDDDDDFIEVHEKEGYEANVRKQGENIDNFFNQPSCSTNIYANKRTNHVWKLGQDDAVDPTSSTSTANILVKKYGITEPLSKQKLKESNLVNSQKSDMLSKAPVLPYDIDLYHWEEEKPLIPETVKFDSLHCFWQSTSKCESNKQLDEEQLACLRQRKIDFSGKFEPVKWACRAPLPNGKLCPRKDRYKCPFHGKIVKRDSEGNVVDEAASSSQSSSQVTADDRVTIPEWQDPELLRDIEAATGINLKLPQKKKSKQKVKSAKNKKDGLTNINVIQNTARDRLSKKIMKRHKHYSKKLDEMERKKFNDKFGDQWNYY